MYVCIEILTDEIGDGTAIGSSTGGGRKKGLSIGPVISLEATACSNVIVVTGVEKRVAEDEQGRGVFQERVVIAGSCHDHKE